MADTMYVIITLRREVPDRETGRAIFDLVKERLTDRPEVVITGHITNHFELGEQVP